MSRQTDPLLPAYDGACTANLLPELVKSVMGAPTAVWVPSVLSGAKQVVLLVLDGLGWEQLDQHRELLPTLAAFEGGPITTVAPTTTVTGLTSIVTGRPPSVHGVLGYRMSIGDLGILNVLRWADDNGTDMRSLVEPESFQTQPAFAANAAPAVTEQRHLDSGFARAHLQGAELVGYSAPSSLPVEVWRRIKQGQPLTYAYYAGIDSIAHAHGFGEHYGAELYTADRLIRDLMAGMSPGTALVVTSDHGQVEVGENVIDIDVDVAERCWRFSGEGRFMWLHAHGGEERAVELRDLCRERYGEKAWVLTKREISDAGWFGGALDERTSDRVGDVALIASDAIAFRDPFHTGERNMRCRHGSMTPAEVRVPLLAAQV